MEEKDECQGKVDQAQRGAQEEGSETAKEMVNSPCAKETQEM